MSKSVVKLVFVLVLLFSLTLSLGRASATGSWVNGVASTNSKALAPEAAYGGGSYATVYTIQKPDNSWGVFLNITDKNGINKLSEITVSNSPGDAFDPTISWNGSGFGIFWYQNWTIYYAQFSKTGTVITPEIALTPQGAGVHVSSVWNSSTLEYGVTWYGNDGSSPIEGARFAKFNKSGVQTSQTVALTSASDGGYYRPLITTKGNGYGIVWEGKRNCDNVNNCPQLIFSRVDKLGNKVGNDFPISNSVSDRAQAITWNGTSFAIFSIGINGVNLTRVLGNNTVQKTSTLYGGFVDPQNIKAKWHNGQYLVSFEDRIAGNGNIYIAKYTATGSLVEPFYQVTTDPLTDFYASTVAYSSLSSIFVAYNTHLYESDQTISYSLNQNFVSMPVKLTIGANPSDYIAPNGSECNINVPLQYPSIQSGVDAATDGDTVCVGPGVYNENVDIDKTITLAGNGATINGQSNNYSGTVKIAGNNALLEGFIINGVGTNYQTAAVRIAESRSGVIVQFNRITSGKGEVGLSTDGNSNDYVFQNNIFVGNKSPQIVLINGQPSLGKPSDNMDFIDNTFTGSVATTTRDDTGMELLTQATNNQIARNVFKATGNVQNIIECAYGSNIINYNNLNSTTFSNLTNSPVKVRTGYEATTDAKNNWWGDLDPSDNIQGNIDYWPYATNAFSVN